MQWGWQTDRNWRFDPLWTLDPIANKVCRQLVKCECNKKKEVYKCYVRCSSVQLDQTCTDLYKCKETCDYAQKFKNSDNGNHKMPDTDDEDLMTEEIENNTGEEDSDKMVFMDFDEEIDILLDDNF